VDEAEQLAEELQQEEQKHPKEDQLNEELRYRNCHR
jgi:hypothetical protein